MSQSVMWNAALVLAGAASLAAPGGLRAEVTQAQLTAVATREMAASGVWMVGSPGTELEFAL